MPDRSPADATDHPPQDDDLGAPSRPSAEGGDDGTFHTDTPTANAALQRGLGVGAAELAAQRDPGHTVAADEDEGEDEDEGGT